MIEAPVETPGIVVAEPVVDAIFFFLDAALEPIGGQYGNDGERQDERAEKSEAHGVGHGMKEFAGGAAQCVDGQITGDDDGNGIKNGAVDVARRGQNHVGKPVWRAIAQSEFAVNVLDHDDGAVNDDAEVDGADGKQVRGFASPFQENEGKKQGKRDGEGSDEGGAETDQEKDQHN